MTKRLRSLALGAALLTVALPLSISTSASEMDVRIPFAFVANGRTLPAGTYFVSSNGNIVLLRGAHKSALIATTFADVSSDPAAGGQLVFMKSGDRYDLVEIWTRDDIKRELPDARRRGVEYARAANVSVERIVIPGA